MPDRVAPYIAHIDGNQVPSSMGVVGTQGTADLGGTAYTLPFSVDSQTGGANVIPLGLANTPVITAITVANGTATALPATALINRKSWLAYNAGSVTCWIGGTAVTASNIGGLPVGTGEYSPAIDMGAGTIYGIAASAGGTLTVLEVS